MNTKKTSLVRKQTSSDQKRPTITEEVRAFLSHNGRLGGLATKRLTQSGKQANRKVA